MVAFVGVIPAHLASVRFPGKILFPFNGMPMIEHVRRRALLATGLDEVYVATCDRDIAEAVRAGGGKVIMTADTHRNGTSRVAEAVADLDFTPRAAAAGRRAAAVAAACGEDDGGDRRRAR